MKNNEYSIHYYLEKNIIGLPCHTYELWRNGEKIYALHCPLLEDGSSDPAGEKEFYRRVDLYMDKYRKEEGKDDSANHRD